MKKLLLAASLLVAASGAFAQTADDIISKYVAAIGGKEKLDGIKNLYLEGNINAQGQQIPIKIWIVSRKSMRVEYTFNGMTGYSIIRNDSGWNFSPFAGQKTAEPLTSDQVKEAQPELDAEGTLMNYKKYGYKVTYEGSDDVDGTDAFKLKVAVSDSLSETYYIDKSSYYILQVKTKGTENGKVVEATQEFSDYQKTTDGYTFAMARSGEMGGDTKFTTVKVNGTVDPKLFSPTK
ncbi:MAG TPA: hypothetical protein VK806_05645 [Bacteroidia bacterium]|jgi:outer membrane lipoprotein-sorting protein|nr:hypothetical protein [Bacteroidia bacterium]